jgi:CRISPR-associated protein Cmr6
LQRAAGNQPATNFGHAYEVLVPLPTADGKMDPAKREDWLARCEQIAVSSDYASSFERWKRSFPPGETAMQEVAAQSRILIGHGNPSGSDVGLTVHRSWGVPMLPGSALKGLVAHYVDAVYGDDAEPERRSWLGPTWKGGRVAAADRAGDAFARLFGAPAVDGDEHSARRGLVEFHDALYVPDYAAGNRPFARDVLTVHQKPYYDSQGKEWPNDWASPNPVGFLSVKPKTRLLLVLTGPNEWIALAMRMLLAALTEWGVGGKTSGGYGRLAAVSDATVRLLPSHRR